MPRILTVDDSRAIRSIVSKQVLALGFEVDEAEDGVQGLARLAAQSFDLVLLDVTMPVLDGPGMLAKMREQGITTPVLMLTSESKRSVVTSVMKNGIEDYILKPFQPDELRSKILKALRMTTTIVAATPIMTPVAPPAPAPNASPAEDEKTIDLLVIDDMENVSKKLRTLLPARVSLAHTLTSQTALTSCREHAYKVILIDYDMHDVNSAVLMNQLKKLQPSAAFLVLCLRTTNDATREAKEKGFDGVMFKPFDTASIDDFVLKYFDNQALIDVADNVLSIEGYNGRDLERYYRRIDNLIEKCLADVGGACYDEAIIDVSKVPARPDRIPKLMMSIASKAKEIGLSLWLVGTPEMRRIMKNFTDTAALPFFDTVDAAKRGPVQ